MISELEKNIQPCDLIIVDELSYITLDRIGAEHSFGFFNQCYERTNQAVTMNLPFADWPQVFAEDERLTGVLLERLCIRVLQEGFLQCARQRNHPRAEVTQTYARHRLQHGYRPG
jgi:DNA replication protein DnaC